MTTLEEKLNALEALNLSAAQDSMGGAAAGETWLVGPLHIMCGTLANNFYCIYVLVCLFVCLFVCCTIMIIQHC